MNKKYVNLSINYGGHDTSAAVSVNDKITAAIEQERLDLKKHSREFPFEAIKKCLELNKININDVKKLILTTNFKTKKIIYSKKNIKKRLADINNLVRNKLKFKGKIITHDHHLCHLASAYYPSGFKKSLILSIDGVGQYHTAKLAIGNKQIIKICKFEADYPSSLGLIYSAITFFLGWKHHCDEGIIMGLAPYGNPFKKLNNSNESYIDVFRNIILSKKNIGIKINEEWIAYHKKRDVWISKKFYKFFGKRKKYEDKLTNHHKNIAAALQLRLEEVVIENLKKIKRQYKIDKLCIAGGVGLNCSLNGKIHDSKIFKEIFVQPASGDSGLPLGGLYLSFKNENLKKLPNNKIFNNYLGSKFTNKEIFSELKKHKIKFKKSKNIFRETANNLIKGKIVAWFQGASEFGPRALGNRSILSKPFPKEMKDYLNKRVKFREYFRPFAPACLEEKYKEYFDLRQLSPHMLIACKAKKKKIKKIPAVVHVDNSCRVQTVSKKNNLKFYKLLKEFYNLTSIPILLNTSFNIKGQPMVDNPDQAVNTFKNTKIDILSIGDYIAYK